MTGKETRPVLTSAELEVALLARGRYPDVPIRLAIIQFYSDRRRAGLGALDVERRSPRRGGVTRLKTITSFGLYVRYVFQREPYQRFDEPPPSFAAGSLVFSPDATVQVVTVPGYDLIAPFSVQDLRDQRGRTHIARSLRAMRRQLYREHGRIAR
jgi:hypothetical protein